MLLSSYLFACVQVKWQCCSSADLPPHIHPSSPALRWTGGACLQLSSLRGLRWSGASAGVEEESEWKRGALPGLVSPHWGSRMDGEEDGVAGWTPAGGSGNHCWCMSAYLDARRSHRWEVSPRVAGGNPASASWDEETGDNEVCRLVSGGQRSCWCPETGWEGLSWQQLSKGPS